MRRRMVERMSTVGSRRMTKVFATRLHVVEGGVAGIWALGASPYASEEPAREPLLVNGKVYRLRTPTRNTSNTNTTSPLQRHIRSDQARGARLAATRANN